MKRNRHVFLVACIAAIGFVGAYLHIFGSAQEVFVSAQPNETVFVLDAGHGGEDGGAISITGTSESGINLSIAKKLDSIFGLYGQKTIMLRNEDMSLHDPSSVTLREKKVSDLKNRVKQVNDQPSGVLISIHQNSYPGEQYWGLQTFYASNETSKILAENIQNAVQSVLQPENLRQAKPIPDNVYLMNHVQCPAVLIECGFLTNREEEARLQEDVYQRKLACVLMTAAIAWSQSTLGFD